jgi:predicted XRE-type DNA-binding protein
MKARTVSSGNKFTDILVANAAKREVKTKLVCRIARLMNARRLKQVDAARLMGVSPTEVSQMLNGRFRQFSVERLMRLLVALGQDVDIVVTPHQGSCTVAQLRVIDGA